MKKLKNGIIVEEDEFKKVIESQQNIPLDRTLITKEQKKQLKKMLAVLPDTLPLVEILLGKDETSKLI